MSNQELNELFAFLNEEGIIFEKHPTVKKSIQKALDAKKEPYLTRKQVASLLQISLPTLHQYTKQGLINSYKIGTKVRYKTSEIDEALRNRNFTFQQRGGNHGS